MGDTDQSNKLMGTAAAICVVIFWSGWIVVSRLGVTSTLTIFDVTGLRFSVAGVVVLPIVLWQRAWRGLTPRQVIVLTVSSGVPYALLCYVGFFYAPAAHGGVFLNGCLPIFSTLFGWLWIGQRSRLSQLIGLGVILTGITLVGYEGIVSAGSGLTWLGDISFLAAIALFAVFIIANRAWNIRPGQVLFAVSLVGAIVYVPVWLLWLDSNLAAAPRAEILLQGIYQGLIPSVMGIVLLNVAVRHEIP